MPTAAYAGSGESNKNDWDPKLLKEQDIPFTSVCEYTEPKAVSRARTAFQQGHYPLLLYTESAHFFRR